MQRLLNGFQIIVRGRFVWANAYGFGIGKVNGWDFVVYRNGWKWSRA
jgi:hypothetical protein